MKRRLIPLFVLMTIPLVIAACSLRKEVTAQSVSTQSNSGSDYVVLLHGLWNKSSRLADFEDYFEGKNYQVLNLDYPSTEYSIEELEEKYLRPVLKAIPLNKGQRVHFVTHSMGGILLRQFFRENEFDPAGRVVMISPPNQGSQWADRLKESDFYRSMAGPAAFDLRTRNNNFLKNLGPANFYLGVIGGNKSYFEGSEDTLPGANDGMVTIESMKLDGMKDMVIIHEHHRGLTENQEAMEQAEYFIIHGKFNHSSKKT